MFYKTEQEIIHKWQGDIHKPVVSICVIAYNHEKYIAEAMDSFLMQETSLPFEIVIGEDCSSDNTRLIINQYINKYPNIIKFITSDNNVGMQKNFIRAKNNCKGEYIAICEGDDYWIDVKKIQIQVNTMKNYMECDMSFHPVKQKEADRLTYILANHSKVNKVFSISSLIVNDGGFCPTSSLMFRGDFLRNIPENFFLNVPVVDYYLQILGSKRGGALYIKDSMSIYRIGHSSSWTHTMLDINKVAIWSQKSLQAIQDLEIFLDKDYSHELSIAKAKVYFVLFKAYLYSNLISEYKIAIDKVIEFDKQSIKYKVFYLLKSSPKVLKVLFVLKRNIDCIKRKIYTSKWK